MFNLPWVRILFLGLSCRSCSAPNCPKMEHWTWSCGWRYDKELRVSIEERKVKSIMFIPEELTRTSRKRLLIWHISRIGFASIIWFPGPAILHPVQYKPPVRTEVKMAQLTKKSFLKHSSMKLPYIGLGTNEITTEEMETALNTALDAGYRHFDTAYRYNNEADIGRSLKKIFESGKIKREELFIVTKLPNHGNRRGDVEYFLKKSLEALQLDYVDLYLVHSPMGYKRPDDIAQEVPNFTELELDMETDLVELWKGMEAQVDAGRAKYIGISKFNSKQIQRILDSCRIRPVNHQMEMQIYLQEKELVSFCQDNDITVTAFSPFGSPGIRSFEKTLSDAPAPLEDPVIKDIANKYNKQPSQIILRFLVECGVGIIPKSSNPVRIQQNIDVFDFELTKEDFERIRALDRGEDGRVFGKVFMGNSANHPEYPFPK
ncbi:unnamed protein product [Nezara viridula]|uniref:NADP-dependent oxidoreductase domain-containing protein n=1 Tax=Nezara viridula TaxID=85310 RepID=A0A9P0HRR1_NEZVI|nr:unnamed protein product [Nezara viridula]